MSWANPLGEAQDEFDSAKFQATSEGLSCEVACGGCGNMMPVVEPWVTNNPNESSVAKALQTPAQPVGAVMQFARARLPAGQGFSCCVVDAEKNLLFALFLKCPACQQVTVADDQLHRVKAMIHTASR